jgi:molybdopterin molybdotransferase
MEAQAMLLDAVSKKTLARETVPLEKCLGRVLAVDVYSSMNIPAYDKTFIDGYAINTDETASATTSKPAKFKIVGKIFPADYPTAIEVSRGETVYVACGAPIPRGASATVKVEETRLRGDSVEVIREIEAGEGIIPLGDDVKKDELVLKKGQLLRPQDIGLLASVNMNRVQVFKKPLVAVISGGDELLRQHRKDPANIANNYALVVAGLVSELGGNPKLMGIMPDALDKVTEKISEAIEISDIVITIGGSSVGVKDFIPDAVNQLSKPGVIVQGVLLRPGAVSGFGLVDGKPIIMLPGHIGSCIAGFYLFGVPLIGMFCGLSKDNVLPKMTAQLSEGVENGTQFRFLLVHLTRHGEELVAEPAKGGSSALTTIVKSSGYTIIPPHAKLEKGKDISVFLFGKLELSHLEQA